METRLQQAALVINPIISANDSLHLFQVIKNQGGVATVLIINGIICFIGILVYVCCVQRLNIWRDHRKFIGKRKKAEDSEQKSTKALIEHNEPISTTDDSIETQDLKISFEYDEKNTSNIDSEEESNTDEEAVPVPSPSQTTFQRIIQFLFLEKEYEIFGKTYGHEVAVYLWLEKQIILAFGICTLVGLVVLLPLHLTGTLPNVRISGFQYGNYVYTQQDYFLIRTTVAMILQEPLKLVIHVIVPVFFIILLLLFMYRFSSSNLVKRFTSVQLPQNLVSSFSVQLSGLPESLTDSSALRESFEDLFPNQVYDVRIALLLEKRIALQKKYNLLLKQIKHCQAVENIYMKRPTKLVWCNRVDVINYLEKKKQEIAYKMEQFDKEYPNNCLSTGYAHVIFKSRLAAEKCRTAAENGSKIIGLYVKQNHELEDPNSKNDAVVYCKVKRAHESHDIKYENLGISSMSRFFRVLLVTIVMIVFFLFFTTPLAIINSAQELTETVPYFYETLIFIRVTSGSIGDLIFQYLPTFIIFILGQILPLFIPLITQFERYKTNSKVKRVNLLRLYAYLIISTLILPSLVLTSIDGIVKYLQADSLSNALERLFLPASGAFFLNYSITYCMLGNLYDLFRVKDLIFYAWGLKDAVTSEEKEDAQKVAEFDIAMEYGYLLSFLGIILTYSTFSPLVLFVGFVYFVIKYALDRRTITRLCDKNDRAQYKLAVDLHSYSAKTKLIVQIMFSNILLFEIFMTLFFAKSGSATQIHLISMIFVIMTTIIYIVYWNFSFTIVDTHDEEEEKKQQWKGKHQRMTSQGYKPVNTQDMDVVEVEREESFDEEWEWFQQHEKRFSVAYLPSI